MHGELRAEHAHALCADWYRSLDARTTYIDAHGRPQPDPARWPLTAGGVGFKPIADRVHALGLKFGIHVMRGVNDGKLQR